MKRVFRFPCGSTAWKCDSWKKQGKEFLQIVVCYMGGADIKNANASVTLRHDSIPAAISMLRELQKQIKSKKKG